MAESTIGLLRVILSSNSAEFTTEMGKASGAVGKFDDSTKKAGESTGLLGGSLAKLTAGFTAALVIDRVVGMVANFGREAFESAGQILDLADKTGLTTRSIQEMELAAKLTGTSLTTFTNAAFQLGVRLSGGSDSVRAAVEALGLSYRELIKLSPDEQFKLIAERLGEVENAQDRNKIAVELFGRTAKDILPAIAQGYKEIADSAVVAEQAQLQALDQARDALDSAYNSAKNLTIQLAGGLVIAIRETWRTFMEGTNTALYPFITAMNLATDAAEAFGLKSSELPKVHGPANAALKEGNGAAQALTMTWEEMARVSDELTGKIKKKTVAVREATAASWAMQGPAADLGLLESRSIQDTARLTVELKRWALANGAVLAPSIEQVSGALEVQETLVNTMQHQWTQFAPTVAQNVGASEASIGGFFQRIFGGAEGLGQSISSIFQQAFMGGGGALGAVQAFATKGLSALLGMLPGIGPFVSGFAGPIVAMISSLTRKFSDFFRRIFGGASAEEMAGRGVVADFEAQLEGALTAAQQAEAGTDAWKRTVIALRDAYIAAGRTEEEALADAKRLWESSKQGAEEAARVIEEIRKKMQGLTSEEHVIEVTVRTNKEGDYTPENPEQNVGFAGGTMGRFGNWFHNFGQGAKASLHGVEAVLRPQDAVPFANAVMAGLTPMGAGSTTNTTSNSINVLPVILGSGLSARDIGKQAAQYLSSSGLQNNESGVTQAIESVIDNWMRTYTRA